MTSTIRHVVTSNDIQYANGRVNVPDVIVDVINSDYDAVPTNVIIAKYTGGLLGVAWDAPAAALQKDSGTYDYALEVTSGSLIAPTLIAVNATCNTPGCTATSSVTFSLLDDNKKTRTLRAASLTVRIRQTDFDDDGELVESIAVNGETVRTNCNPGGPPIGGGLCADNVKDQTPTCVKDYQLNTTSVMRSMTADENSPTYGQASVSISIKVSDEVDKSTCLDKAIDLLHADVYLTLMYKSSDEVYFGPALTFEQADLIHSTNYKVRVASSSPQGIFSSYSTTTPARTNKPTAPTEPRATHMVSSTGGKIDAQWLRPKDTGGATLVAYFVQAAQLHGVVSDNGYTPVNHDVDTSTLHDPSEVTNTRLPHQSTYIYGLRPFATYNVSLFATNEVEFCEGPGPSSTNATMETIRPTRPGIPSKVEFLPYSSGGALKVRITPPLDRGGHTRLAYDIAYRAKTDTNDGPWFYDHAREGDIPDTETLTTLLVNLDPLTEYQVKARTIAPIDNEHAFTTSPTVRRIFFFSSLFSTN